MDPRSSLNLAFPGLRPTPPGNPTAPEMQKADMIDGLRKGLEVICAFDDGTPKLTQSELAQRLDASRTKVPRLLNPDYTTITLSTLQRAAGVAGHRLVIGFEATQAVSKTAQTRRRGVVAD